MPLDFVRISKFLSLVLRHEPARAGVTPDAAGWVAVDDLLRGCASAGLPISRAELEEVVRSSDKQRFAVSPDGLRIRANQGHSVEVRLDYEPRPPPEILFHGTATRFLASIRAQGLVRGERHHVHLSADVDTALKVGRRHGQPVVLHVRAGEMCRAGREFFVSANGVWLTEHVPAEWLIFPASEM
jgi:putative RNA 2'-phosphotransferase